MRAWQLGLSLSTVNLEVGALETYRSTGYGGRGNEREENSQGSSCSTFVCVSYDDSTGHRQDTSAGLGLDIDVQNVQNCRKEVLQTARN